ncbi:hypothetical protein BKE30_14710 [Alkanindiges hydrocarboniclasticus]|uniref:DNA 3'-5' helicase n=1 Tax=Alkanindiges hydrocarboniclasticus TaxID=1907941 RepID=A0A1S8CSA7_9GAMM|nr:hypothetical protein BKE30_14710 [Alkanindiges hydrocarboniclasticus]
MNYMFKPTTEQEKILHRAAVGESFKVMAYAGTGKTSTLGLISKTLAAKSRKGTYLAFNKSIADEAAKKFDSSVDARTFHSLAFRQTERSLTEKLKLPRIRDNDLATHYGLIAFEAEIDPTMRVGDSKKTKYIFDIDLFRLVKKAVSYYCSTHAKQLKVTHFQFPDWMSENSKKALGETLLPIAHQYWHDQLNPNSQFPITHEIYLKKWAIQRPQIRTDYIMFDEAQDADPLMLGVLLEQKNTQVIYVGDAYQQIYDWRGAVNAMIQLNIPAERLTQSFRFGHAIADNANLYLNMLGESVPLVGTESINSRVLHMRSESFDPDAILCRTNRGAIEALMNRLKLGDNRTYGLVANSEEYIKLIEAGKLLKEGRTPNHPAFMGFTSWHDVKEYTESDKSDFELAGLVRLEEKFGFYELEKVIKQSIQAKNPQCVISTAHKSKGLEWNKVDFHDDFELKLTPDRTFNEMLNTVKRSDGIEAMYDNKPQMTQMEDSELRLLYVAVTRSKVAMNNMALKDIANRASQLKQKIN